MEPLSALGVASNILQLVDFVARLAKTIDNVLDSSLEALPANIELSEHSKRYKTLYENVQFILERQQQLSDSEKAATEAASNLFDEVNSLTTELKDLEISVASTKMEKGMSTIRQFLRTRRKHNDLDERRRKLDELTNLLSARLLLMLQERTDSKLQDLKSAIEDEGIRNSKDVRQMYKTVLNLVRGQEQREAKERTEAIRRSLRFESMDHRRNIIPERHRKTFEWCFQEGESPLLNWLEAGNNMFWICGKAGAGKSTFMKFLGSHRKTVQALKKWSGSKNLVIAEHYFYYAGSLMQRSHQGLLQSLLAQVLKAGSTRNFASKICPERWYGDDFEVSRVWSRDEITEALLALDKLDATTFCFFIDGLDEYHPHTEHDRLISELTSIVSLPNIKICTSSRPWTEFVQAFGSNAEQLRLEELTKSDIAEYAKESIKAATPSIGSSAVQYTPTTLDELGLRVTERAQGVFLWVYLVVSALKERLKARNNIDKLFDCIQSFPADLEDFFRGLIYNRIHETLRNDTAQCLKLAWLILQHAEEHSRLLGEDESDLNDVTFMLQGSQRAESDQHIPPYPKPKKPKALSSDLKLLRSFIPFWVLRTGMQKPESAITMEWSVYPRTDLRDLVLVLRQYLNACCKDLLWVSPAGFDENLGPFEYKVEFLHRTVYDFLSTNEMMKLVDANIPKHFNEQTFMLDVTVASLKVIIEPPKSTNTHCGNFYDAARGVVHKVEPQELQVFPQGEIALRELDTIGTQYVELFCDGKGNCVDPAAACELFELMIHGHILSYTKACVHNCLKTLPHGMAPRIPSFAATRSRSYIITMTTMRDVLVLPPNNRAFAVLLAALGLDPPTFAVERVDEELVGLLLRHNFSPNMLVFSEYGPDGIPASVWTLFLQTWMQLQPPIGSSVHQISGLANFPSSKAWRLAKLMIISNADLTIHIFAETVDPIHCFSDSSVRPIHPDSAALKVNNRYYALREILERCVPEEAKQELESFYRRGASRKLLRIED